MEEPAGVSQDHGSHFPHKGVVYNPTDDVFAHLSSCMSSEYKEKNPFLQDRLTLWDCLPHVTSTSSNSSFSLSCHSTEKFGKHPQEGQLQSITFV